MSYREITNDLETMGTGKDAVILAVGLVKFNFEEEDNHATLDDPERCFYAVLDAEDQIDRFKRSVTFDTMKFWVQQSKPAIAAAFLAKPQPVEEVLHNIVKWVGKNPSNIWGNGNTFDNVILESLFNDYGIKFPFNFWEDLDLRTLKYAAKAGKPNITRGLPHHALEDAKYEVLCAQEYWRSIHGS